MALPRQSAFLPTIKCSSCGRQVEISMMGEHLCTGVPDDEPPLPPPPPNFDQFMPYNKGSNDKTGRSGPPPKVDTSAANRTFYRGGQLTPVSNSSGSRSVSPKTPVGRPGVGGGNDYFAPKIANEYDSTPPQQSRRPGGYGAFSDADGFDDPMYPATSPKKAPSLLDRMNSLAPGPFDVNRRGGGARNAFPARGGDVDSSDDGRSDLSRSRALMDRPGTSTSMRSNGSSAVPPRVPKKDNYEGFGSRRRQDDFEPESFGKNNRAGTFPRQAANVEMPLRTPSAPGPRPERFRRPSNDMPTRMPSNGSRSRRPSMGPDTSRPPPPRTSIVRPRTAGRDGSQTPSINLAAEFGIGNPYHTPSESMSSSASTFSRPSQASSSSSPSRSMGSRSGRTNPSENSSFDNLMADLQSMSDRNTRGREEVDRMPSLRHKRSAPTMDAAARSRSRSRSRPRSPVFSPIWEAGRGLPVQIGGREYSPPREPRTPSRFGGSSERRTRSRSRGREPGLHPSRGICKACNDPISGKAISSADGQLTGRYHKACFVCTTCSAPFTSSTFYVYDDKPYCERHYHEMNGSLCGSCGDGVEGQYLADEADKKYHPECFICNDCGKVLRDGYFEVNGKAYCEKDAWKLSQMPPPSLGRKSSAAGLRRLPSGGLPSGPGVGFGLPTRPALAPGSGPSSRLVPRMPRMEKRMTRLGMM